MLCERNGGKWNIDSNLCICHSENVGRYCKNLKVHLHTDWNKLSNYKGSWTDKDGVDAYLEVDENDRHIMKKRPLIQNVMIGRYQRILILIMLCRCIEFPLIYE